MDATKLCDDNSHGQSGWMGFIHAATGRCFLTFLIGFVSPHTHTPVVTGAWYTKQVLQHINVLKSEALSYHSNIFKLLHIIWA